MEGLRNSPPTEARGFNGLGATLLDPELTNLFLGAVLTGLGDLSIPGDAKSGDGSLEELAPDRRFRLLFALKGVFSGLGTRRCGVESPGVSHWLLKVFVEARKSARVVSPL
jgi:hypothetical protein